MKSAALSRSGDHDERPWYRQVWPWFLIAFPLSAVLAGIATLVLAVKSDDGLVAEDYYKQGLAINRVLASERFAAQLGLRGQLTIDAVGVVRLQLRGREGLQLPASLALSMVHPTRAGADQNLILQQQAEPGVYSAQLEKLAAGRWLLQLGDVAHSWRINGNLRYAQSGVADLLPEPALH